MWKPASVVPEHKRRATVIWGSLLLSIVGYTGWQVKTLHDKYTNPSTNFSVSDDTYKFPTVDVCVWRGEGCDANRDSADCIGSARFIVLDPCENMLGDIQIPSPWANCLALDLSSVSMEGFEGGCAASKKPAVTVMMTWVSSLAPDEENNFGESVGIFLGDESPPEYVMVPYSRVVFSAGVVPDDVTYLKTFMTIGKSTRNYMGGDSATSYAALSYSTVNDVDQMPTSSSSTVDTSDTTDTSYTDDASIARGYLYLVVTQGGYSLTELTDINPLDVAAILGNIGGFWELMLVIWAVCFMAARIEAPTHKGRDFSRPLKKGREIIASRKRRRTSQPTAPEDSEDRGDEEQPRRSAAGRGQREAPDASTHAKPPVGARPPAIITASTFRRPTAQDYPTCSFSAPIRPV